jgi:adenylate cyclase
VSEAGVERRLTTILSADVVGFSRLMAADEAGTLAQLKSHHRELIEPKTSAYQRVIIASSSSRRHPHIMAGW